MTSAWLRGMGLPDSSDLERNTTLPDTLTGAASRRDPHTGLLLNKNGPTADCSSAGATIHGAKGLLVGPVPDAAFVLGFDYRNGTHCGGGSPRFNVLARHGSNDPTFHFIGGCASGVATPAPQDPTEWTRVRLLNTAATAFPPIPPGSAIESIELIVDEGTDTISLQDPQGVGLSVVDNIFVNGLFIRSGQGIAQPTAGGEQQTQ